MANEQHSNELLIEQYKLLADYRKYLGTLLMQMTGGVVAIFTILIGLLGGQSPNPLLRLALAFGSVSFGLLAFTSHRLRHDEGLCVDEMHEIETVLKKHYEVKSWPIKEALGARIVFIVFLCLVAGILGYLCYSYRG